MLITYFGIFVCIRYNNRQKLRNPSPVHYDKTVRVTGRLSFRVSHNGAGYRNCRTSVIVEQRNTERLAQTVLQETCSSEKELFEIPLSLSRNVHRPNCSENLFFLKFHLVATRR